MEVVATLKTTTCALRENVASCARPIHPATLCQGKRSPFTTTLSYLHVTPGCDLCSRFLREDGDLANPPLTCFHQQPIHYVCTMLYGIINPIGQVGLQSGPSSSAYVQIFFLFIFLPVLPPSTHHVNSDPTGQVTRLQPLPPSISRVFQAHFIKAINNDSDTSLVSGPNALDRPLCNLS